MLNKQNIRGNTMKRRSGLIIVAVIMSMLVACEMPVEPVEVTINEVAYIDLNWVALKYQLTWDEDCLSQAGNLSYITGQNPSCDSLNGTECSVLRLYSIQHDAEDIFALLDYSYAEHPGVIMTKRVDLGYYLYDEK